MANSKEVAQFNTSQTSSIDICSQRFIDKLPMFSAGLPAVPCLLLVSGEIPKLEKLLRIRAVETQLLFQSSEAALLKCVGTSHNLVTSLFPMLVTAIERNTPTVAVRYLEKARIWITDLIGDVEQMVEKYEAHNRAVAATTSDIITEQKETENRIKEVSKEIEELIKAVKIIEDKLKETTTQVTETERKIDFKNRELQDFVKSTTSKSKGLSIFAAVVPSIGLLVKAIYDTATAPRVAEKIKALEEELNRLNADKIFLKQQEWVLQIQLIDYQMKLSKAKTDHGLIPDPVHLSEVQRYLSKIQDILLKLTQFWKSVDAMLDIIKEKTFVGKDLLDDPDLKDMFLKSIQDASKMWRGFGRSCNQCVQIFRVQSRDAYKFLEIDPNTLSPAVWQKEYNSVIEQLNQLKVIEDGTPAIQQ